MKPSDSTNSLTELTGRDECFICLCVENDKEEPLVSSKLLRTCGCKFFVHPECWNQWIQGKSDYDCPICRKASMLRINIPPNPVFYVEGTIYDERRRCCAMHPFKWLLLFLFLLFGIGLVLSILLQK
jgi:hypothetical protein